MNVELEQEAAVLAVASVQVYELCRTGRARQIREAAGLIQADIAKDLGVDPSTVARWERGEKLPAGRRAVRYQALLEKLADGGAR